MIEISSILKNKCNIKKLDSTDYMPTHEKLKKIDVIQKWSDISNRVLQVNWADISSCSLLITNKKKQFYIFFNIFIRLTKN